MNIQLNEFIQTATEVLPSVGNTCIYAGFVGAALLFNYLGTNGKLVVPPRANNRPTNKRS